MAMNCRSAPLGNVRNEAPKSRHRTGRLTLRGYLDYITRMLRRPVECVPRVGQSRKRHRNTLGESIAPFPPNCLNRLDCRSPRGSSQLTLTGNRAPDALAGFAAILLFVDLPFQL